MPHEWFDSIKKRSFSFLELHWNLKVFKHGNNLNSICIDLVLWAKSNWVLNFHLKHFWCFWFCTAFIFLCSFSIMFLFWNKLAWTYSCDHHHSKNHYCNWNFKQNSQILEMLLAELLDLPHYLEYYSSNFSFTYCSSRIWYYFLNFINDYKISCRRRWISKRVFGAISSHSDIHTDL